MTKSTSSYKLVVSEELEQKIRYYLGRFPNIEYSGTLFYKTTGSFETNDLVVNAIDFLLQDIGTGGYTEFNQSPDVIAYMVDNPELLGEDVYQGLMHSHHTMGAFFSGTDTATLREEGSDRTHFVSLIIDTKGTYQAAITRVIEEEMTATGNIKYKTFNEKVTTSPISYTFSRKRLEYFMLEVTKPIYYNPFQELNERIDEVYKQKAASKAAAPTLYNNLYSNGSTLPRSTQGVVTQPGITYQTSVGRGNVIPVATAQEIQSELPFESDNDTPPPYGHVKVDSAIIEELAKQLLSADVTYDGVDSLESLSRMCGGLFGQRFISDSLFHAWAESYVEFLVYYTEDPKLDMYDDDTLAALVAFDLKERLDKLLVKNKYITEFIDIIERYII